MTAEDKIVQGIMTTGSLLSNTDNPIHAAINMARSAVVSEANASIGQWLNQFGTARVQLNIDNDFHLDGSALDFMLPLYDNSKSLLFTQLGARNKSGQNTFNIGAGARIFQNNWMFGVNTFFDHDLTAKNRRIGLGAEVWADYLKLSANSYFSLNNWHQSQDFIGYNARPANGYDLRVEAYLPSYPQLGGKLMFEQYYGDEVALFATNHRQKNPNAITVGINCTPIPLLTLGVERRKNDTFFNFQMNYRLGESWQAQINPSAVTTMRTRVGNRYDLVERNNHIVLDHQKQQVIRLTLPQKLSNVAGNTFRLTALVTAKHGLGRIDWDRTSLLAAGGTVTQISQDTVEIKLPSYPADNNNVYTLSAVAPIIVDAQNSTFTVSPDSIIANGKITSSLTFTAKDASNQPLRNLNVSFKRDDEAGTRLSAVTENKGVYSATLTGNDAKAVTITPHVGGQAIDQVRAQTVTLMAPPAAPVAPRHYDFTVSKERITADGEDEAVLTFTAKDASNQPLCNLKVSFNRDDETGTRLSDITEEKGVYRAKLKAVKGTLAKAVTITPHVEGQAVVGNNMEKVVTITITARTITPDLHFANAQQSTIYTKNFIRSQAIRGMPDNVEQIWSSSDNSVATVDNNGKVTLIKSGEVKITVYTSGNAQYNPAKASYVLTIDKADPKLQAGDGNPITATWADGKSYSIAATFGNADVGSSLTPVYTSQNTGIVTVNGNGTLNAIKPGRSTVSVSTRETDQFKAASADVLYLLNKGTVNISFDVTEVKTTDEETFTLQKTKNKVPSDADVHWGSSDSNVVNLSSSESVQGKVGKGRARLTLNVAENDFYSASSGHYDVLIYSQPIFELEEIRYSSHGNYSNNGDWIPVYADDDIILPLRIDTSNEFNQAGSVTVYLFDDGGQSLGEKEVPKSSGIHEIHFSPQYYFWGRQLYLKVIAKGQYGNLITANKSKFVSVKAPDINDIGSIKTTATASAIITSTGELDNGCQMSFAGRMHHVIVWPKTELNIPDNKKLITQLFISHKIVDPTEDSREVNYNDRDWLTSSGVVGYKGKSARYAIKEECWDNHKGSFTLQTMLQFGEKEYNMSHTFSWHGKMAWKVCAALLGEKIALIRLLDSRLFYSLYN
ncbi:inverse autotransporter beta domain-containing protein [Candidatus Regiella insecticola]|uniref:inverse autotransporter beta domain-containing protein n=1 Tax=Candidatus Regiella insecticola TaxID=138073 RepID=UPI001145C1FC|nr:inverse autotransporter beta domain-containing protein [Candidatus Regiella insecticola]